MSDDNRAAKYLKAARERRGLTLDYCAAISGIESSSLFDVELYSDEFIDNMAFGQARRYAFLIGVHLIDFLKAFYFPELQVRNVTVEEFYGRSELLTGQMTALGLDVEAVSDAANILPVFIGVLERTPDYFECMRIEDVVGLEKALQVEPGRLLASPELFDYWWVPNVPEAATKP